MTHSPGKIEYNCRYFIMTFLTQIHKKKFGKKCFRNLQGTMSHRPLTNTSSLKIAAAYWSSYFLISYSQWMISFLSTKRLIRLHSDYLFAFLSVFLSAAVCLFVCFLPCSLPAHLYASCLPIFVCFLACPLPTCSLMSICLLSAYCLLTC
jgi:hypothetical protein